MEYTTPDTLIFKNIQNIISFILTCFFLYFRQDSKTKFVQNSTNKQNLNSSVNGDSRPKTTNHQSNPKSNSANVNTTNLNAISNNNNNNINNSRLNSSVSNANLNQTIESVHNVNQNEIFTSKNILINDTNNNFNQINSQNLNDLLPNSDSGLNEYTVKRIIKWLEDIEKCSNKIKPPTQLTWSNSRAEKLQSNMDSSRNFNSEYCLSDYDSLDDQIIEYNRVVDKTFHIVHDEN